jgi:lysyl endopeptidase
MPRNSAYAAFLIVGALLGVAEIVGAADLSIPLARASDPPRGFATAGLGNPAAIVMPPVDESRYIREDAERIAQGIDAPLRFAASIAVDLTPATDGSWVMLPDGGRLWRLEVISPGARTLNFGITTFRLPDGATLHLYPAAFSAGVSGEAAPADYLGPYTSANAGARGEFWTPVVDGDAAVIEMYVPPAPEFEPSLRITQVSHDYRGFHSIKSGLDRWQYCENDVVCPEWDPWDDQINSAGVYTLNGGFVCSGTMLNSVVSGTPPPYFLTAMHCNVSPENVATMCVYWNYQAEICGYHPGGWHGHQNTWAQTLAARSPITDFCLVLLGSNPPDDWNVYYTGWNAAEEHYPTMCVGIHHPGCQEKAISYNDDSLTVTGFLIDTPGIRSHWRVDNWEDGTVEAGSSGSGCWDQDHRLLGQLQGGLASCDNIVPSWYGRLARSWTGSGTPDSRVSDWLDPNGTGVRVIDGRYRMDPSAVDGTGPGAAPAAAASIRIEPNPARGTIHIRFALPGSASVGAEILDSAGRRVAMVAPLPHHGGEGTLSFDLKEQGRPRGLYFVRLTSDGNPVGTCKLVVVE